MTERPIIFNGDMVRAILRGEKTQTRRPVKPQPVFLPDAIPPRWKWKSRRFIAEWVDMAGGLGMQDFCPFGQPYDRLWGRETWRLADPDGDDAVSEDVYGPYAPFVGGNGSRKIRWRVIYRATSPESHPKYGKALWTPSIHMPRWASRITLEITDINVERVQDITEDDARAEGVNPEFRTVVARSDGGPDYHIPCSYRGGFANTWDAIYAKLSGLSWDEDPWVWAITFRRVETSHEN